MRLIPQHKPKLVSNMNWRRSTVNHKHFMLWLSLLVAISFMLGACGPAPTETVPPTEAAAEVPAVPTTTRKGGWIDEINYSVVDSDSALTQIQAGALDIYGDGLASADLPAIKESGLSYKNSNGLYYDIMYNPVASADAGKLNPFADRRVREATNWLFDRNYINQEVYAGGGLVKFFPVQSNGPDYADLADVARELESKYAYNPDKAREQISTAMTEMGATMGADGKWQFKGKPVTIIFLVRNDSDGTRVPIGDYVTAHVGQDHQRCECQRRPPQGLLLLDP